MTIINGQELAEQIDKVTAVAVDPGNAHADHYLRGMANGLILAQSIVHGTEPEYIGAEVVTTFDYMAEADKTCSVIFAPENISSDDFVLTLTDIVGACEMLNKFKKLLVRGKTPEEVGFPKPALHASLAVEFDANNTSGYDVDLLHGIVGVITEAGEMAEVLLHRIKTGEFDRVNAFEEVGDVSWYLARQLRGLNSNFAASNRANIDKLHGRHGEAFDVFRDANRDLTAERERLEGAAPLFEMKGVDGIDASKGENHGAGFDPIDRAGYAPKDREPGRSVGKNPPGVDHVIRKPVGDVPGDCG